MPNVNITWELPTTRDDGSPLNPSDIKNVDLYYTVNGGTEVKDPQAIDSVNQVVHDLNHGDVITAQIEVIDTNDKTSGRTTPVAFTVPAEAVLPAPPALATNIQIAVV